MRRVAAFLWLGLALIASATDTNIPKHGPLVAGQSDRVIARVVVQMLERNQYLQQPFNEQISSRFLDRYINTLDPFHLHFLQSDLADFEMFRTKLGVLMKKNGETSPAYYIANVFIDRVEQRMAYCQDLLKNEKFEFNDNERVVLDRKNEPFPKDIDEARRLWRSRLRIEVLQEVLNQIKPTNQVAGAGSSSAIPSSGLPPVSLPLAVDAPPSATHTIASTTATNKTETPVDIVNHRYNRVLRLYREWDSDDVLEIYLTSLAHVYDPHSDYLGKSQLDNFSINMGLSLTGIGARLTSEDGYCTIVELTDGGPAKRSGKLKPKDRIVAVAQGDGEPVDVVDTKLNKVVEMIRGSKGTEVRLTIIPVEATHPSTRKIVSLVREEIKLEDQEAKAKLMELPGADGKAVRLGVIDLPSFYADLSGRVDPPGTSESERHERKSTSADVAKLLRKLCEEKVQGVVLDLRRNGGGSLQEAVKLTGLFIKSGPVVQVCDPDGAITHEDDTDESIAYDGPLIVLTSHFSASASEILAGALQDYGRAVIVGDTSTHGKGTVQALTPLAPYIEQLGVQLTNDPGALKFTIRKFYRASGASTQLKGVTPDIVLPSVVDAVDVGEASLDDPLTWDTIKPADYHPMDVTKPFLPELKQRASARVASEKDFAYIREDYELAKKNREDKAVSVNLADRLKEKAEAEGRKKARDAERLARGQVAETDYEITLKLAALPGLPDPVGKTNETKIAQSPSAPGASVSTNAASVAMSIADRPKATSDEDDELSPKIDVPLEEAKRVLLDYLHLLADKRETVMQTQTR